MFYSIFIRGDFLEYHVSQNASDCVNGVSMSRRINYVEHPESVERFYNKWVYNAQFYNAKVVQYLGGQ